VYLSTSTFWAFVQHSNIPIMSVELTIEQAEQLIRRMTDGLVNIKDESGEFLEKREPFYLLKHAHTDS